MLIPPVSVVDPLKKPIICRHDASGTGLFVQTSVLIRLYVQGGRVDEETERALLKEYPLHVVIMVKAAMAAVDEGRAQVVNGRLICTEVPKTSCEPKRASGAGVPESDPEALWFR